MESLLAMMLALILAGTFRGIRASRSWKLREVVGEVSSRRRSPPSLCVNFEEKDEGRQSCCLICAAIRSYLGSH